MVTEVDSESGTDLSDGSKASTASPMPKRKRCSDSSDGQHRKIGFDPKLAGEFKWLEKVRKGGRFKLCKKHCKSPRNVQVR